MTPDCMTPDELALWTAANRVLRDRKAVVSPCADCPWSFAEAMRAEGRCNGEPVRRGAKPQVSGDYAIDRQRRLNRERAARWRARVRVAA